MDGRRAPAGTERFRLRFRLNRNAAMNPLQAGSKTQSTLNREPPAASRWGAELPHVELRKVHFAVLQWSPAPL